MVLVPVYSMLVQMPPVQALASGILGLACQDLGGEPVCPNTPPDPFSFLQCPPCAGDERWDEQAANVLVDSFVSVASTVKNVASALAKKVFIYPHIEPDGKGDYFTCVRLFDQMRQFFPNVSLKIAMPEKYKSWTKLASLSEQNHVFTNSSLEAFLKTYAPDLTIHWPLNLMKARDFMRDLLMGDTRSHLGMFEHGCFKCDQEFTRVLTAFKQAPQYQFNASRVRLMRLGVNRREVGLVLDHNLMSIFNNSQRNTPSFQLQNLASVPQVMQSAILGDKTAAQFIEESWSLFFGYSAFPLSKFAFASSMASSLPAGSQACFVFVGEIWDARMDALLVESVKNAGYTTIEKIRMKNGGAEIAAKSTTPLIDNPQKRVVMRIISVPSVSDAVFQALFKASSGIRLTTGDVSVTAGLSSGFPMLVEMRVHKKKFMKGLVRIASEVAPALAKHARVLFTSLDMEAAGLERAENSKPPTGLVNLPAIREAFVYLREHPQLWDKFTQEIHLHNAWPKIRKVVGRMLI